MSPTSTNSRHLHCSYRMTTVELLCDHCGKIFKRRTVDHDRMERRGMKHKFCSRSCIRRFHTGFKARGCFANPRPDVRKDKFTPVRWHHTRSKRRANKLGLEFNLTLDFLLELWNLQRGRCALTGWELSLRNGQNDLLKTASLDRIDSTRGYVEGNVQFVVILANLAKNRCSVQELVEFCKAVTEHFRAQRERQKCNPCAGNVGHRFLQTATPTPEFGSATDVSEPDAKAACPTCAERLRARQDDRGREGARPSWQIFMGP